MPRMIGILGGSLNGRERANGPLERLRIPDFRHHPHPHLYHLPPLAFRLVAAASTAGRSGPMPPATRRSSGWLNNGLEAHHQPNLEYFIEHLEQFKRKHISQNMDIIKSNAFLQIRIKDLEGRIQNLEGERMGSQALICRLQGDLRRLSRQKAAENGKRIWMELGKSMGFLDGEMGHRIETALAASSAMQDHQFTIPPSSRISIDPEALPPGVARGVAQAPIFDLIEEDGDEGETLENAETLSASTGSPVYGMTPSSSANETAALLLGPEEAQSDYATSSNGNAAAMSSASRSKPFKWASFLDADEQDPSASTSTAPKAKKSDAMKGKQQIVSAARRVGSQPVAQAVAAEASGEIARPRALSASSTARQSARSKTVGDLGDAIDSQPVKRTASGSTARRASKRESEAARQEEEKEAATETEAASRKRKPSTAPSTASTRNPASAYVPKELEDATDDQTGDAEDSEIGAPMARFPRRSSVRSRASVNYALPKLNTKMRKPDPEELRPANGNTIVRAEVKGQNGSANGDLKSLRKERESTSSSSRSHSERSRKTSRQSSRPLSGGSLHTSDAEGDDEDEDASEQDEDAAATADEEEDEMDDAAVEEDDDEQTVIGVTARPSTDRRDVAAHESNTPSDAHRPPSASVEAGSERSSSSGTSHVATAQPHQTSTTQSERSLKHSKSVPDLHHRQQPLPSTISNDPTNASNASTQRPLKRPSSSSSLRSELTDADLALLAASSSSAAALGLADLQANFAWPSTPQIGGHGSTKGLAGKVAMANHKGALLSSSHQNQSQPPNRKVAALGKFSYTPSSSGGAGAVRAAANGVPGGFRPKPFNLVASTTSTSASSGVGSDSSNANPNGKTVAASMKSRPLSASSIHGAVAAGGSGVGNNENWRPVAR